MKLFVFITHITPPSMRSSLRQSLYDIHKFSLQKQTYSNWKQFVIGSEDTRTGNYFEVKLNNIEKEKRSQELKTIFERKDVQAFIEESDYILKLDDDDIISPTLLENVARLDLDLYYDKDHTFYDISSGCVTQQKRPWVASTCVHRTSHALSKLDAKGSDNYYQNSLLYSDHSQTWHKYYANKNKMAAPPTHPLYLRVLSPTSITSGAKKFPLEGMSDVDFEYYYKYLRGFGDWNKKNMVDFESFLPLLETAWQKFSGTEQRPIPGLSVAAKIKNYGKAIRRLF